MLDKLIIAITTGDPAGIDPEICLRLRFLLRKSIKPCVPIVFGDVDVLRKCSKSSWDTVQGGSGTYDTRILPSMP